MFFKLLDGDYLSDVDPGNKGTIAPQNSMMYLQDTTSNYSGEYINTL